MPTVSVSPSSASPRPGPNGHWFWGCMSQVARDPLNFYFQTWQQYGECVRIHASFGIHFFLVSHPDQVEYVLLKNNNNYKKPELLLGPIRHLIGNGLFSSAGDFWLRQRRLTQPAFHRQHLVELAPRMVQAAED